MQTVFFIEDSLNALNYYLYIYTSSKSHVYQHLRTDPVKKHFDSNPMNVSLYLDHEVLS